MTALLVLALLVGIGLGFWAGSSRARAPLDELSPTNRATYAAARGILARRASRRLQARAAWN